MPDYKLNVSNQIIQNLGENGSDYQINGFFYNKIFDERNFWEGKGKLNTEKLKVYKEILKKEYFDYLDELKYYDIYFKTKKFQDFLKIKNELKYILDVLFNLGYVEAFYFWYDFKTDDWDENEEFWKNLSEEKELVFGEKKVEDTKQLKRLKKEIEKLEEKIEEFKNNYQKKCDGFIEKSKCFRFSCSFLKKIIKRNENSSSKNKINDITKKFEKNCKGNISKNKCFIVLCGYLKYRLSKLENNYNLKLKNYENLKNKAVLEVIVDRKKLDKDEFEERVYERLKGLQLLNLEKIDIELINYTFNHINIYIGNISNILKLSFLEEYENNIKSGLKENNYMIAEEYIRLLIQLVGNYKINDKIRNLIEDKLILLIEINDLFKLLAILLEDEKVSVKILSKIEKGLDSKNKELRKQLRKQLLSNLAHYRKTKEEYISGLTKYDIKLLIELKDILKQKTFIKKENWEKIEEGLDSGNWYIRNKLVQFIIQFINNKKLKKKIFGSLENRMEKWLNDDNYIMKDSWIQLLGKLTDYKIKIWNKIKSNTDKLNSSFPKRINLVKLLIELSKNKEIKKEIWAKIENNIENILSDNLGSIRNYWLLLLINLSKDDKINKKLYKKIESNIMTLLSDIDRGVQITLLKLLLELSKFNSTQKIWYKIKNKVKEILNNENMFIREDGIDLLVRLTENNKIGVLILQDMKEDIQKYLNNKYKSLQEIGAKLIIGLGNNKSLRKKLLIFLNFKLFYHQIENFLNFESGSFLLTGYRGVGKTTFLKQIFNKYNQSIESNEKLIPVFVNIPEPTNKNGKKEFDKKQLMNFIIRKLYFEIQNYKRNLPKDFVENIEDQYIRTYSKIDNYEGELIVKKRGVLRYILSFLQYGTPFGLGLLFFFYSNYVYGFISYYLPPYVINGIKEYNDNTEIWKLIISFLIFIIGFKISFSVINVKFKSNIIKSLYDENIAEQKLVDNLRNYTEKGKKIIIKVFEYIEDFNFLRFFKDTWNLIKAVFSYFFTKLTISLILLINNPIYLGYFALFLVLIFETIKYGFNIWIIGIWIIIIGFIIIKLFFQPKPKYKFVIVIDELDKLLDFEKLSKNKKGKLDMEQIFDVLGKLKVLFFDTKGVLFFAVANKDAYDCYLKHKNKEDDIISNVFNQIAYLPMNEKEKFNLNYSFVKDISQEELYDLNTWIYFKSHGNWRKAKFVLNNYFKNKELEIKIDEEDKIAYEFFSDLYEMLKKGSLDNFEPETALYKYFVEKQIISEMYDEFKKDKGNEIIKLFQIFDEEGKENKKFNYIKGFVASIDKISSEPAFRDYILNALLNLYEIFKEGKLISLEKALEKIGIKRDDLVYEDFIKYYLPLMFYVLNEENEDSGNKKG